MSELLCDGLALERVGDLRAQRFSRCAKPFALRPEFLRLAGSSFAPSRRLKRIESQALLTRNDFRIKILISPMSPSIACLSTVLSGVSGAAPEFLAN